MIAFTSQTLDGVIKEIQDRLPLEPAEALQLISAYLDDHPESSTPVRARLQLLAAAAYMRQGQLELVERSIAQAQRSIDTASSNFMLAESLSLEGYLHVQKQHVEAGQSLLQRAFEMFRELGTDDRYAREIFTNIVWLSHATMLMRPAKALELLLQALHFAQEQRLPYNRAARHADLGNIYLLLEQYDRALEIFEQARHHVPESDPSTLADILSWTGICCINLRQIERAIDSSGKVLDLPNNRRNSHATAYVTLAHCYIQRNDLQRAERMIDRAEEESDSGVIRRAMNALLRGQLLHRQGKLEDAVTTLERSLQASREGKVVRLEHRAALELASLYIGVGNESKALQCYRDLYSLHYHSVLARQVGEVERLMANASSAKYFDLLYVEDDQQSEVDESGSKNTDLVTQLTEVSLELNQKRRYLQQVLNSLNSLPELKMGALKKELEDLQSGIRSQLSASNSWDSLDQKLLRLAGPDFQRALLKRGPNLTPTELRVCALIRCDLSTKEIAQMLGTSIRTIDTHRTRIRKKLGMGVSDNLYTYLMAVI